MREVRSISGRLVPLGWKLQTLRSHPFLLLTITAGLLTRIVYDVFSVQSGELTNWIFTARAASTVPLYNPGIYTAGAYMFSVAYRLWLAIPVEHPDLGSVYSSTWPAPVFQPTLANYIFVFSMKIPIIFFDLLTVLLIVRVVALKSGFPKPLFAAAAWAWNPLVTLLENYSGIDTAAAFFLLLTAYLFERKRSVSASIALALGTLLRLAPAAFLPGFALSYVRGREWRELLKLLIPGSLLVGTMLIFYATNYGFGIFETIIRQRPGVLVYETLAFMGPALKPRQGIEWNGFLAFNLVLYFLLVALTSFRRPLMGFGDQISSVLLAFFATSWFHFAFLLCVLPFVTIDNLGLNRRILLYILLSAAGLLWTIFQASTAVFSFGTSILFIPVTPDLYPLSQTLATLQFYKGLEFIRSFLSGVLLVQLALIVSRNLRKATNSDLTRFVPGNRGRARSIREEQR